MFDFLKPKFTIDYDWGIDKGSNKPYSPKDFEKMFAVIPVKDQFGSSWFSIKDQARNMIRIERLTEEKWIGEVKLVSGENSTNAQLNTSTVETSVKKFFEGNLQDVLKLIK